MTNHDPVDPIATRPMPTHPMPTHPMPTHPETTGQAPTDPTPPAPPTPAAPATPPTPAAPAWVTGPNPAAILVGLLCIVAGALTVAQITAGFTIDWATAGPGLFTGLGILLVLVGGIGIVRRRRHCG